MKVKQDQENQKLKKKPVLKVKKETKNGESSLNKAVKNVKQILKKKKVKAEVKKEIAGNESLVAVKKPLVKKSKSVIKIDTSEKKAKKPSIKSDEEKEKKTEKVKKNKSIIKIEGIKKKAKKTSKKTGDEEKKKPKRGLVYIGHIPHGFYEDQIKGYFTQFGKVTKVRVVRSKKTGKSRGYAYVQFALPEVAMIAAESMNNYLMDGRLIKTEYIAPEKQHKKYFKGPEWSAKKFPTLKNRKELIKKNNGPMPNKDHEKKVEKSMENLIKLSDKLKKSGIDLKMKVGEVKL